MDHYPRDYYGLTEERKPASIPGYFPCPFPRNQHEGDAEIKALADILRERLLSPELMGLFKMMLPHMDPQEVSVFLAVRIYR